MKYFLTEIERKEINSTVYHEFFKGKWNDEAPVFWKEDSLNLDDDKMFLLQLDSLIQTVVEDYTKQYLK